MKEYDFALTFKLNQAGVNPETYLDALYEAGCDDALLGIGKPGYLTLDFIRESSTAFEAIKSAISNVRAVLSEAEAKLIHVSPDLVGIKELAEILQCTRQNIQKIVNKSSFPSPVYKGSQTIWHLGLVLDWFIQNNIDNINNHKIKPELLEIAELAMSINLEIDNQTAKPQTLNQAKNLIHC